MRKVMLFYLNLLNTVKEKFQYSLTKLRLFDNWINLRKKTVNEPLM